ncbi:MAG TPA: PilT/PilU family type 4a pilus ATPase [Vicinamibacterales bacterium]|nr:PilT/PilU family type 4a pilus ATPase [Vicinamibacterales bacterium]
MGASGHDDLDQLVTELNLTVAAARQTSADAADTTAIVSWLGAVREAEGSDLLLVAGAPPVVRASGRLLRLSEGVLSSEDVEVAVVAFLTRRLEERYRAGEAVDLAFTLPRLGRFRMNLHRERGRAAAAIRALPMRIPKVQELRFTHEIEKLARLPRGLVLIGGPTGSGKTTTLAALVEDINVREARHIITVEDPIEYEHQHVRSIVEQVEIGNDAADFPTALRAAVRQAPDVIVVGEMRDPETMRIALSAAETGHLVFATVHTTDVSAAISRIGDAFPAARQNAIRQDLAMALAAVLTQTLLPSRNGGLVPAAELLMVGYGARQHIRKNALQHLNQEITITRKSGSFTFEESLARLVHAGAIDRADALLRAAHADELESLLNGKGD